VLFNFRESPRFLITKGRDAEAVAVCHAVAATNGRTCALTLAQLQELDDAADADDAGMSAEDAAARGAMAVVKDRLRALDLSHLRGLFASPRMARLTLLAWAVYMADHWSVRSGSTGDVGAEHVAGASPSPARSSRRSSRSAARSKMSRLTRRTATSTLRLWCALVFRRLTVRAAF
jgi:hypothetical protein